MKRCSKCPVIWPGNDCCFDGAGLFCEWRYYTNHKDMEKAKEYAEQIRDIQFKEEQ